MRQRNNSNFCFQNTYTNAEKLLAAAEELAQTGECNADDIYSVARELEAHISSFARRVEQRRHILDLAVLFFSHVEELSNWFSELKAELTSKEVSETYEGDSSLDACASTISEGQSPVAELNNGCMTAEMESSGSLASVQSTSRSSPVTGRSSGSSGARVWCGWTSVSSSDYSRETCWS